MAAGDGAPVNGPGGAGDLDPATSSRRNIGLILSLLAVAALLILAALLMRGSDNVKARNDDAVNRAVPQGTAPGGGVGPASAP